MAPRALPDPDGATVLDADDNALLAPTDTAPNDADPGIGYIFERTRGRKCLVFVNSREEAEAVCSMLRSYCEARHEPDRFLIHHGNLSASYRETAEDIMRDEEQLQTTVTTATLELGIDIGRLERAFQIDAPFTVSSFLQRMGRTGRRDDPPGDAILSCARSSRASQYDAGDRAVEAHPRHCAGAAVSRGKMGLSRPRWTACPTVCSTTRSWPRSRPVGSSTPRNSPSACSH